MSELPLVIDLDIFHGEYEGRIYAEVEFPDLETAALIAVKLSCSIDSLMGLEKPKTLEEHVYSILATTMPGTLQDILEKIKKDDGNSGARAS